VPDISWGEFFGPPDDDETHSIRGCSTFMTTFADGSSCTSDLPCSAAPPCEACSSGRGYSAAYLLAMLEHPDVVPALSSGTTFGAPGPGGAFFRVTIGRDAISIGNAPCERGPNPDCVDAPPGVRTLRQMLADITAQQPCTPPASACALPFDPGTGPGEIVVYAFHPPTGTCVPQMYTGAGGNANRFDDVESCRAACPTTATADVCPPNRTFVADVCLDCGNGPGGCGVSAAACAKVCASNADCAGEGAFVTCSSRGLCDAGPCD
jgi:hypothetical protein